MPETCATPPAKVSKVPIAGEYSGANSLSPNIVSRSGMVPCWAIQVTRLT